MLTQVIQLELIDLVTGGIASFNDMLNYVYGDDDGMVQAARVEIGQLADLLVCPNANKIQILGQMFLEGNIAMVAPDTMDLCVNLEKQGTPYLVEIVDKGETLCFLKQEQIIW